MADEIERAGFVSRTLSNWGDAVWWADNISNYVIFSIFLGLAFAAWRWFFGWIATRKFRNWKTTVVPKDTARKPYTHPLLWDEAREILGSRYKERQYIQSVVSSEGGWLENGEIETDNKDHWVYKDMKSRTYHFDVAKFPSKK